MSKFFCFLGDESYQGKIHLMKSMPKQFLLWFMIYSCFINLLNIVVGNTINKKTQAHVTVTSGASLSFT